MKFSARDHFFQVVLPSVEEFVSYYEECEFGLRKDTRIAATGAGAFRDPSERTLYDVDESACAVGYSTTKEYREALWVTGPLQ